MENENDIIDEAEIVEVEDITIEKEILDKKEGIAIVITSGKGGVGKTTASANISTALAMLNKSVVVLDADIGLRNLDVVMGMENRIVYDIVDVVEKTCKLKQSLIRDKRFTNLYLLPAAQTKDKSAIKPKQMAELIGDLKQEFDFIIIDSPSGIEEGFKYSIVAADRAIIITTPEISAVRSADRVAGLLEINGVPSPKLIVNRIKTDMVKRGDMMSIEEISDILSIELIGVVADDEEIFISSNKGEPAVIEASTLAGKAYMNIAKRLIGEDIPLLDLDVDEEVIKESKFSQIKKVLFNK